MPTLSEYVSQLTTLYNSLINDRTQANVNELVALLKMNYADMSAAQKTKVNTAHKGAYNYNDRNRVGNFFNTFTNLMHDYYGTNNRLFSMMVTTWQNIYDPSVDYLHEYVQNVIASRDKWYQFLHISGTAPAVGEIYNGINLTTANNIETVGKKIWQIFFTQMLPIEPRHCGEWVGDSASYTLPCGMTGSDGNAIWIGVSN